MIIEQHCIIIVENGQVFLEMYITRASYLKYTIVYNMPQTIVKCCEPHTCTIYYNIGYIWLYVNVISYRQMSVLCFS